MSEKPLKKYIKKRKWTDYEIRTICDNSLQVSCLLLDRIPKQEIINKISELKKVKVKKEKPVKEPNPLYIRDDKIQAKPDEHNYKNDYKSAAKKSKKQLTPANPKIRLRFKIK